MDNLVRIRKENPVYQQYAVVTECHGDEFCVRTQEQLYCARRAASCLVHPQPGDRVLVCCQDSGDCFILAVLEAASPGTTRIALDGDLRLELDSGELQVAAQDGIGLATAGRFQSTSGQVQLNAVSGKFNINQTVFNGACLQATVERIRLLAASTETLVQRLVQRAKRVFRSVEQDEVVKVGHIDVSASKLMTLSGKYTIMTAKEDVKIDAERIHIG